MEELILKFVLKFYNQFQFSSLDDALMLPRETASILLCKINFHLLPSVLPKSYLNIHMNTVFGLWNVGSPEIMGIKCDMNNVTPNLSFLHSFSLILLLSFKLFKILSHSLIDS